MWLWAGSSRAVDAVLIRSYSWDIDTTIKVLIVVDQDFFAVSTRKEHTVYLVVIWTVNKYMRAFKSLLEDELGLVKSPKNDLANVKSAAFADTRPDKLIQSFIKFFQFFDVFLVALVFYNSRGSLPLQKSADGLRITLFFCLSIDFVVVRPKRVEFILREPHMLEASFYFDPIHGCPDVAQGLSDVYKEYALRIL